MNYPKLLAILFLLGTFSCFSQEPKRSEGLDSIINVISKSTKGINYLIGDTGINSELNDVGTSFFKNKYIILSNKKRRHADVTVNPITNTPNNNLYCVDVKRRRKFIFPFTFLSGIRF